MTPDIRPPKYYQRFFQWFCHPDFYEELIGDLEETFTKNIHRKGKQYARQQYRKEVIKLLRPSVFKGINFDFLYQFTPDMLQNYFKIALRNLKRDKVSSFINIFGLCIGLASTFCILLFVWQEMQIDTAFVNSDRIYRVTNDERPFRESGRFLATVSPPFAPTLSAEQPEVESAVRFREEDEVLFQYKNQQFYEKKGFYVDKDFFKLFDFPLKKGNAAIALSEPNSIILTPNMAQKYFGEEDPMGKTIHLNNDRPLKVTGLLMDNPKRTHLDFDYLISFETFKVPFGYPVTLESWGWISFHTYILLKKGVKPKEFESKLADFAKKHIYVDRPVSAAFGLQPLSDIYFHSADMMNTGIFKKGSLTYIYGLLMIAFLILLVAGFNFMNISTARSIKRAKEVGVRKVLGAQKSNLVTQFIGEALLTAIISLGLAVFVFELFKHQLSNYLAWSFDFHYSDYWLLLPLLLGITLLIGFFSAIYPAILLARFKPLQVLKGVVKTGGNEMTIRKGLVIFQFAITVGLIICSLVISRQMEFISQKNLGYDKEQLVYLQLPANDFLQRYQVAKNIFQQNSHVIGITAGDVMDGDYGSVPMTPAGAEQGIAMNMMGGYFDYFTTLGIDILQGRDFSSEHPIDTLTGILINEAALKVFGWEEPIGQKLQVNSNINGEVIGVAKDFHFHSLHDPITPMVIVVPRTHMSNIILRINPADDMNQLIASLQKDWQEIAPEYPFQFAFVDDNLKQQYETDQQFSRLISFFSWLAIFIAGLGLYGLIAIIATYKIKEIGIRKVLGASVYNISVMLSKNFLLLVLCANLFALPIAWWVMQKWLQNFTFHASITFPILLKAILISLFITLIALSYQVLKSALGNPIQALRDE